MPNLSKPDMADQRHAAIAMGAIGHLMHSRDHQLTKSETKDLDKARKILSDLITRIENGTEMP